MIRQPILSELKYFVNGVLNLNRGISAQHPISLESSSQLVKCSLNLLEELPAAREVVFEYFALVFDVSVRNYILFTEKNSQGKPEEDEIINDIQEVLESLVTRGSFAWTPLISTWSLRLLGKLSTTHSHGRILDIGTACGMWLGCNAMRCLLGLSALCFGKLNGEDAESCITTLLATFVQNSPNFDWVVARLGGCFPLKIISKILQCGLKGFQSNFKSTLDSEVGILSYLSYSHQNDLKFALKEIWESVLNVETKITPNKNAVPYLLHLAEMSEDILQPIVSVFLDLFKENLILTLTYDSMCWPKNITEMDLLPILTSLALKIKDHGVQILLTLSRIAEEYKWCQELLEYILQELETIMLDDKTCSLLKDVLKDTSRKLLWKSCFSDKTLEQQTAVRLILIVTPQTPYIYYQTIAELLCESSDLNNKGLASLIRLLNGSHGTLVCIDIKSGIDLAFDRVALNKDKSLNIIKNILKIVKLEKTEKNNYLKRMPLTTNCRISIGKILDIFKNLLDKITLQIESINTNENFFKIENDIEIVNNKKLKSENDDSQNINKDENNFENEENQLHLIVHLLDILEIGDKSYPLDMSEILKLAQYSVKYFFWLLTIKSQIIRLKGCHHVFSLLSRQCTNRNAARTAALRELLEGALYTYSNLFGTYIDDNDLSSKLDKRENLLITINQKQGIAPNSCTNRSILHAGVIGQGPKTRPKESRYPDQNVQNMLIEAISACCNDQHHPNTIDAYSTVATLLVEMVSPDIMYNSAPWPEEEFAKVTMERDLQIRRTFRNCPILWSLLSLVATYRPALACSSVLLRGLCASVLHQWRAKPFERVVSVQNSELMFATTKLLEIMTIGQLLMPPLSYLHIVVEDLEPQEIALVLKECVWNYMRDNVPSPSLFHCDKNDVYWRNPAKSKPPKQFTEALRCLMQKKIEKFGVLYNHMFVLPYLPSDLQTDYYELVMKSEK